MQWENFAFISQLQILDVKKKTNFYFSEFLGPTIVVSVSLTLFSPDLLFLICVFSCHFRRTRCDSEENIHQMGQQTLKKGKIPQYFNYD